MKQKCLLLILILVILNASLVLAITQEEAVNIAQDYAINNPLPSLITKPDYPIESGYEIKKNVTFRTDEIERIEEQSLWAIPANITYQIFRNLTLENEIPESLVVYVDDITATVIPELSKIVGKGAFGCSDKSTDLCSGISILFDTEAVATYSWVESNILEEICICKEKDKERCRNKLIDPAAYKYIEERTDDWNRAQENILNSCEGFSSIESIVLEEDEGNYFRFYIRILTPLNDVITAWDIRGIVREAGGVVSLKFEKETGKIFEQRRSIDLSNYENTLIKEHNARKQNSVWYIPPSELREIVKYNWVKGIVANSRGELFSRTEQDNTFLYIGIAVIVIIFAVVLWKTKKIK